MMERMSREVTTVDELRAIVGHPNAAVANKVRDHLSPDHRVYVELSNEVWNTGFTQAKAATERGLRAYPGIPATQANDLHWFTAGVGPGYFSRKMPRLEVLTVGVESAASLANALRLFRAAKHIYKVNIVIEQELLFALLDRKTTPPGYRLAIGLLGLPALRFVEVVITTLHTPRDDVEVLDNMSALFRQQQPLLPRGCAHSA